MAPAAAPRLTWGIAAVTVVAFVVAKLAAPADYIADQAGFVPLRVFATATGFIVPAWLTPITATLAHGGWAHLGFNMLMLVYCGQAVEKVLGPAALAVLYLVGAYVAAMGQYVVDPGSPVPMIGASGAISAVLAVYALLFGRNEVKRFGPIPSHWMRALWLAVAWTAVQWLVGVATSGSGSGIATAAHVGGFLAGLTMARPLLAWRYRGA